MSTVAIDYSPELKAKAELFERLSAREPIVENEIGLDRGTAVWQLEKDTKHGDLPRLDLSGVQNEEAHGVFTPDQIANEDRFRARLQDLSSAAIQVHKWRRNLEELHGTVKQWVRRRSSPPTNLTETGVWINEAPSGRYQVPGLEMEVPAPKKTSTDERWQIRLQPIAAWVVAANGRVDLVGPFDRQILLLRGDKWYWVNEQLGAEDEELTEAVFNRLLDSVWK